jgi:transcriptional regulator NrdR family protein
MKCPQCGADTTVDDTRVKLDGSVHRKRTCYNYHVYRTEERVVIVPVKRLNEKNLMKDKS